MWINHHLDKKFDLDNLKSNVDHLDTDELKAVTDNLNNLESTINKIDVDKLS